MLLDFRNIPDIHNIHRSNMMAAKRLCGICLMTSTG